MMKFTFSLTAAAPVTLSFTRLTPGHVSGTRCRLHARIGRRCTVRQRSGSVALQTAHAGSNTFTFRGRVAGRVLRPGRYQLTVTPDRGRAVSARFTVPALRRSVRRAHH